MHRHDLGCGPVYDHIGGMRGCTDIVVSTPDGRRQAAVAIALNPDPATVIPASLKAMTTAVCSWPQAAGTPLRDGKGITAFDARPGRNAMSS
ncbi:hypothetical protein [Nonomuraea helvata]|uniref:Uncharacterized protein n=1 Tax=Nonomuraea helvata TaxID=37484 RepID=A0ABV5SEA1_9ACTN